MTRRKAEHPKHASLRPRNPIKRTNPKRRAKEFPRCYHSKKRVEFVKGLDCIVCSGRPSENAHTASGGTGRKADYTTIVPLCRTCHRFQHAQGWKLLVGMLVGIDDTDKINKWIARLAAQVEEQWQERTP